MNRTLQDIGEDALIAKLTTLAPMPPPPQGAGDDCAVFDIAQSLDFLMLLKTDALVENVHFLPTADPRAVGWKAISRVVSDFAAMGGIPQRFLVTLALPPETQVSWVEALYCGMAEAMNACNSLLVGGETTSVPKGSAAVVSVSATGRVQREALVTRSEAKIGDDLWVTGTLGGSIHGKHLNFTPRLAQGGWLARQFKPTAMMDLSDGLAKDLPRLAAASGVGFRLEMESIPTSPGCSLAEALGDGEDFELLFTQPAENARFLQNAWSAAFPNLKLTRIGKITCPEEMDSLQGGWEHFRKSPQ